MKQEMTLELERFLEVQTEMLSNLTITDSIDIETLTDICEEYHKRKLKTLAKPVDSSKNNTTDVMWRCNRRLTMLLSGEESFTSGLLYRQTIKRPLALEDNQRDSHVLGGWENSFTIVE
jgi:hypothetical protein